MRKVLHLAYNHQLEDIRIYHKECKTLSKNGYNVMYITSDINGAGDIHSKNFRGYTINDAKNTFRRRSLFFWKYYKKKYEIRKKYWDEIEKTNPDVIHFHEEYFWAMAKKMKEKGYCVIYDAHEDIAAQMYTRYISYYGKSIAKILRRIVSYKEQKMMKYVDYVITATPHIKNVLKKKGTRKPIIVVNNYPLLEGDLTMGGEGYLLRESIFFYAGGLVSQRRIPEIAEAAKYVSAKVVFAGDISDDEKKDLLARSDNKVEFMGMLDRKRVNEMYQASIGGFVLYTREPNHYCAKPIKMFEYMLAGIPFICSDFPLWRKLVEKYECGICINQDSIEEIIDAMNYIINNKKEAKIMGENGRKAVLEKFNWSREEKKLLKLYENM